MSAPAAAPGAPQTTSTGPGMRQHWTPTYALAGVVAATACALPLAAVMLVAVARSAGVLVGYSAIADSAVTLSVLVALAGLVAAAVIAVGAARTTSPGAGGDAIREPRRYVHSPSLRLLVPAACFAAFSSVVLFLIWGTRLGHAESDLAGYAAEALAVVGLAVAAVLAVRAVWPGRPTSLRTRAFLVIAVAVLIPSLCLGSLGVWAYYRSWNAATSLYYGQAGYQASELASEIHSMQHYPGFTPMVRARLADAIAQAYGRQGHLEGAQLATLSQLRQTSTLPGWALQSLERRAYAIGDQRLGPNGPVHDIVAWRVGANTVRYYVPQWTSYPLSSPPTPVDRLLWIAVLGIALIVSLGLAGAWLLSRGVVRPVRRLAEASGRLADGEAGVTVRPEGPRELRELAASFNDMNAKLAKAQETEQAFLLSVSHELKTPLTSIRGYAEGIGDGTVEPQEGSSVIGAESSRLERLVGDLLDSARMRKSAFTVRREQVDLAAVAQDVARRYEVTARDAGLALNVVAGGDDQVVADTDRVLQVVSNLVENAIRCTPAPGTITVSTGAGHVSVADTGRGLTSDDLPRAFERFYLYSRYGNDRPVGTGLGLAIVKELTEAMGGSVTVSSALGVGTAFVVTLPADGAQPADPRTETSADGEAAGETAAVTVERPGAEAPADDAP